LAPETIGTTRVPTPKQFDHDYSGLAPAREDFIEAAEDVCVGVVHETGQAKEREKRMSSAYPDLDVLVFGHWSSEMNPWRP
jgi:hypothetical protein